MKKTAPQLPLPEEMSQLCLPRWEEMPDIDLYMDQLISLIDRYLKPVLSNGSKELTPSMVNNYVKAGIIPVPVKKKYNRPHLAALMIICLLKPVLPIPEIGRLIQLGMQEDSSLQALYTLFLRNLGTDDLPMPQDSLARIVHTALMARSYQAQALQLLFCQTEAESAEDAIDS